MADQVLVDSVENEAADTIEELYKSPAEGNGTIITAFSAINNSGVNASYAGYIYNSDGDAVKKVIPLKIVVRDRFDVGPSITNQFIEAGGTLRTETSAIGGITFRVSGVEL